MLERKPAHNSRFAKAGVSYFYDSEVLNSSFVHLMKFSAESPRLRKAAKRQAVKKSLFSPDNQLSQSNIFVLSQAEFCYVWVSVKNI